MILRRVFLLVPTLLLVLCLPNNLDAQSTTSGGLTGVVTDPSGAVIPDAHVEIKDDSKGTVQSTKTDREGVYRFHFVAPGRYTLTVMLNGFRKESRVATVLLGPPVTVNLTLELATESTTVKVTEEAPLIHAENGDASSTMSSLQVAQVPNPGNDLTYIAQTASGAIMNTDDGLGNFSILGMPGNSNIFTLNGMSYTGLSGGGNPSGATNLLLGINGVQEATIVSNGYSGQFGVLAGAAVSYITKSGGNDFHGNALYFWNGSVLNANDWLNNAGGIPRPFENANQWAGSIGGPIKKDKLFFFFDTEGLHLLIPQAFPQVVLPSPQLEAATIANIDSKFGSTSASDAFYKQIFNLYNGAPGANRALPGGFSPSQDPTGCTGFTLPNGLGTAEPCAVYYATTIGRPTYESLVSGRVDWNIRLEDRIFLLVDYDYGHQASSTDPISPLFNVNSNQPWWQGQLVETHTFAPSVVNQFLLAGWRLTAFFGPANFSETHAALPTLLAWYDTNTFTNVGTNQGSLDGWRTTQYQVSDDIVKTWGNHKLGFGANLLKQNRLVLPGVDDGTLVPFTLDAFYQGGFDPSAPFTNTTLLTQSFPSQLSQPLSEDNLAFYAQEEWHARSNLSLTVALRAEHPSNPVCQTLCFARLAGSFESVSHDPDQPYNQAILVNLKHAYQGLSSVVWAPRFSFAWQPLGVSRNTVVRGGIGIFYNALPIVAAISMASNPPLFNQFNIQGDNIAPNETTSLFKDTANSNADFLSGFAAGESFSEIHAEVNGFSPPALSSPDRLLKLPQYQKWSLEVQQSFGAATSMSLGYFGNHGLHELIQNQSANAFGFGTLPSGECTSSPVPPCADPRFGEVTQLTTAGVSNYNGLVVSFQHRFTGWSQGIFQANYTYGHAFDEVSNGGLVPFAYGSSVVPQDPNNFRGSYGSADYDVRHSFNANYVWEVPVRTALRGHGPDYAVKGWQISGTVFARTGFPYTVIDNAESFNLAANNFYGPIYAVPVGPLPPGMPCGEGAAIPLAPHPCQPPQVLMNGNLNSDALFVQAGCETGFNTGNLPGPSGPCGGPAVSIAQGRNRFRYPNYFDADFSIVKNTKIPRWENAVLGIGFQFFNFFNHPNFGGPDNYNSDTRFGQIYYMESPPTGILGAGLGGDASPRNIQLKVQLQF
jgi:Carboxypeptidase regulatory-like domain